MKKFLVPILSVLYMASALSLTVHVHYCMGEFAGIRFIDKEEEECGKCGMKKSERSKDCCKDDHKTFKANDHQLAKASFDFFHHGFASIIRQYCFVTAELAASQHRGNRAMAHAPPTVWRTCAIYILNRNFRI